MGRFFNLFLVVVCFTHAVFSGASRKKLLPPKRAVIIQRAALGDMVCTTPLFHEFKRAFPSCSITVVGNDTNRELLAFNTDIDEYIVWRDFRQSVAKLKRGNFDVGILVAPSPDSLSALLLSGIPWVVAPRIRGGRTPFQTISYRVLLNLCDVANHTLGNYASREYLRLLECLGVKSINTKKYLAFSSSSEGRIEKFFKENKVDFQKDTLLIGIAPGAGADFKRWPAERFGVLAGMLYEKYRPKIFIIGSKKDILVTSEMKSSIPHDVPFFDTTGLWNIDELKVFISKLGLFVSSDTGPIYIAEAFGVPTVDIVGPVDEKDQPPRGPFHEVVFDNTRARPVTGVFTNKFYNYTEARRQAEAITVEQVFSAVQKCIYEKNTNTGK